MTGFRIEREVKSAGWLFPAWLALSLGSSACTKDGGPEEGARFLVQVSPLSFPQVSDVLYRITVRTATGQVVWDEDASSTQYGDGAGALAYIGPCDASDGANPHTVQLEIVDLLGPGGSPLGSGTWQNPAPLGTPVELQADCRENADVPILFNLTIMRSAGQGFFDIAVNFEDIFCSAKFDCLGKLLFDPLTEEREATLVMGFACTSGQGGNGAPEPTWLHLTDVVVQCDNQLPIYFDPSGTPGQHGPLGLGTFFESAIYQGDEQLPGYDKCYWNMAFGINLPARPANCTLTAQGTASHLSFAPGGVSPANTIWPYVSWTVNLTDGEGDLDCTQHALDSGDGVVATHYTPITGGPFQHEWQCGTTTITSSSLACDGEFSTGHSATVYPTPTGLSVDIAGNRSKSYRLPSGYFLGNDAVCCANPCCEVE